MNLPELLSASGAQNLQKSANDANHATEAEDGDAFLKSMNSVSGGEAEGGDTEPQLDGSPRKDTESRAGAGTDRDAEAEEQPDGFAAPEQNASPTPRTDSPLTPALPATALNDGTVSGAGTEQTRADTVLSSKVHTTMADGVKAELGKSAPTSTEAGDGSIKGEKVAAGNQPGAELQLTASKPASGEVGKPVAAPDASTLTGRPIAQSNEAVVGTPITNATPTSADQGTMPVSVRSTTVQAPGAESRDASQKNVKLADQSVNVEQSAGDDEALNQRQSDRREDNRAAQQRTFERQAVQNLNDVSRLSTGRAAVTTQAQTTFDGSVQNSSLPQFGASTQVSMNREAVAERPVMQTTQAPPQQEAIARNATSQIASALKNQPLLQKIDLSLDPPELGRIEIQMEIAEMGLRATLAAERPGTTDMIRRQSELLIQQFDEAGFSDVSLNFSEFGSETQQDGETASELWLPEQPDRASGDSGERRSRPMPVMAGMDMRL